MLKQRQILIFRCLNRRIVMKENEIKEVLRRFNQYLNEQLWMDFELIEFSRN